MFSYLPTSRAQSEELTANGLKSFIPGRNLPKESFRKFNFEGTIKREYLFHKSAQAIDDASISDEAKLGNNCNLELQCLAKNIHDIAIDIWQIHSKMEGEKDELAKIDSKLKLVMHVLTDTSEIKEKIESSTTKLERRIVLLESMLETADSLKKKN